MKTVFKSASDYHRGYPLEAGRRTLVGAACIAIGFGLGLVLVVVGLMNEARAESLWGSGSQGARSMFADRKAAARGDILTIEVSESAVAQSSQSKSSKRESSLDDAIARFIYSGLGKNGGQLPASKGTGAATYSGGGDVSNSQSLTARAAVLVTDVLPNGNLVIEGVRIVTFSGETQYVVLHGLVRPDDITKENTVTSSNIADARVEFHSEGSITDAQKRGWLSKAYEKLRPL